MAVIGPTGCNKTTHAVGYVNACRKYVLALDPKGEDETLTASGYTRVRSLPRHGIRAAVMPSEDQRTWREIERRIEQGHDARVIVGGGANTDEQDEALRKLMREAITYARHSGGWTLFVDEFELLSSQRMMKLGDMIERMLITARRAKTTVITTYQAPAWVSKHATRQARKAVIYPQSTGMIKSIAEEMDGTGARSPQSSTSSPSSTPSRSGAASCPGRWSSRPRPSWTRSPSRRAGGETVLHGRDGLSRRGPVAALMLLLLMAACTAELHSFHG